MSAMSRVATEIEVHGWQHAAPMLWRRTMSNGQLAAVWSYSDESGAVWHKLLTDRDRGDYPSLDAAMFVAGELERGAEVVAL